MRQGGKPFFLYFGSSCRTNNRLADERKTASSTAGPVHQAETSAQPDATAPASEKPT